jgi:hypothetical protein
LALVVTEAAQAAAAHRGDRETQASQQNRDLFGHDASFVFDPSGQELGCEVARRLACDRWENRPARRSDSGEAGVIYLKRAKRAKPNFQDFSADRKIGSSLDPFGAAHHIANLRQQLTATFAIFWSAAIDCRFPFSCRPDFLKVPEIATVFQNREARRESKAVMNHRTPNLAKVELTATPLA